MNNQTDIWTQIQTKIEKDGWTYIGVPRSPYGPELMYTVGLQNYGLPELMLLGAPLPAAKQTLRDVAHKLLEQPSMAAEAMKLQDGQVVQGLAEVDLLLLDGLADAARLAITAGEYAKKSGKPYAVMQVIYPDDAGLFPTQEGCNENVAMVQDAGIWVDTMVEHTQPRVLN